VLAIGAAGAVLILLALREVWAHAIYTPPHPIPRQDYAVTGQSLIPLASALAIAALACLAAVIATRGTLRRAVGALLTVIGGYAAVTVTAAVTSSAVLATAQNAGSDSLGGSTTSGTTGGTSGSASALVLSGVPGHAVMTGLAWHIVAAAGAVAIVLAGLATLWRGPAWPAMSPRFERPDRAAKGTSAAGRTDSATMWESLSRDVDPTVARDVDPTVIRDVDPTVTRDR
jgi:uncharacterized membrane protein (TIGR02234 family)